MTSLLKSLSSGKRQLLLILKRLQREERVDADAVHLRVGRIQLGHRVAERAQLLLAHELKAAGKEREHHRLAPLLR